MGRFGSAATTSVPKPVKTTFKIVITPPPAPKKAMHATYTVEVNKMGQVVRVRSVEPSKIPAYDAMTYGNALQAFIRKPDGTAIAGVYKLTYDYSPQTKKVHRDVQLLQAGGVDPNAEGAVTVEMRKDQKAQEADRAKAAANQKKLPDFNSIVTPKP